MFHFIFQLCGYYGNLSYIRTRHPKKRRRSKSNLPEDIRQEERELERRLEERVRKKKGNKGTSASSRRGEEGHHFNDPVLISVLHGLQGLAGLYSVVFGCR